MSSSCFTSDEALYGYKEDQKNEKEQEELITDNESEEESVLDFNTEKHHFHHNTKEERCEGILNS